MEVIDLRQAHGRSSGRRAIEIIWMRYKKEWRLSYESATIKKKRLGVRVHKRITSRFFHTNFITPKLQLHIES